MSSYNIQYHLLSKLWLYREGKEGLAALGWDMIK